MLRTQLTRGGRTSALPAAATYALTVNVVGGGAVARDPDQATYNYGDEVELTATADPGWTFAGWSGGATGSANPTTVTMDGDKTVTATFTQDEYALTVNVVGGGAVARDPDQATYNYGDEVELTATADPGWTFAGWSGGATGSANPTTVTMDGDKTLTAHFVLEFSAIDVTAPATDVQKDQGGSLDVSWTTNAAVSSGQFSIWVVSSDYSGWYGGKIHDAADTLTPGSYSDTIDLNVPAGTGYRIYVYYRAGTSGPWSDIFDDAAGRVDVAAVFSAIDVTAPATDVQKDQGGSLDVSWTTNAAVSSGQFSIWVVSADYGGWYGGKIHDAADTLTPGSYSDTIDLNVPAGTGYRIYVYYRAGTSGPWSDIFDDAAGRVDVAAVFSAIDVTAPATDVQKDQGGSLDVSWTTNAAVSSGQFSIWVVSADYGGWYGGKIHDAADTLTPGSYSDTIDLNVPAGTGYRIYVYYRAGTSGPWSDIFDDAAGRVDVTAPSSAPSTSPPRRPTCRRTRAARSTSAGRPTPPSRAASSRSGW